MSFPSNLLGRTPRLIHDPVDNLNFSPFGVLALSVLLAFVSCSSERLDDDLCPADREPLRTTVLLLDTSDPLTPKLREELQRLVDELTGARGSGKDGFLVAPGEALIVYELTQDLANIEPVIRVCNPGGDPDDWGIRDDLTKGQEIAIRRWKQFVAAVEPLFERTDTPSQAYSPIIETLGVIVPRHATSQRNSALAPPVHLILYSDLLQHSEHLSQYGIYPSPRKSRKTSVTYRQIFPASKLAYTAWSVVAICIGKRRITTTGGRS